MLINIFLLTILFVVLAALAAFWYWGMKDNEAQKEELQQQRKEKIARSQQEKK